MEISQEEMARRGIAFGFGAVEFRGELRSKGGVGTELKRLLAKAGFVGTSGCGCDSHAAEMDANGIEWCQKNSRQIVDWLAAEAGNRGLPFSAIAGWILVRSAIAAARRKETA